MIRLRDVIKIARIFTVLSLTEGHADFRMGTDLFCIE